MVGTGCPSAGEGPLPPPVVCSGDPRAPTSTDEVIAELDALPTGGVSLGAGRDGRLHVLYSGSHPLSQAVYWGPLRYRAHEPGVGWGPDTTVGVANDTGSASSTLVLDADDTPLVISNDVSAPARVQAAAIGPAGEMGPWNTLFDGAGFDEVQGVAALRTSDGAIHAVLLMNYAPDPEGTPEQRVLYLSRATSGSWSSVEDISDGSLYGGRRGSGGEGFDGFGGRPQLRKDASGNLWLLWRDCGSPTSNRCQLVEWLRPAGGAWSSRYSLPEDVLGGRGWVDDWGGRHVVWSLNAGDTGSTLWQYSSLAGASSQGEYYRATLDYLFWGPIPTVMTDTGLLFVGLAHPVDGSEAMDSFLTVTFEPGVACAMGEILVPPEEIEATADWGFDAIVAESALHFFWLGQVAGNGEGGIWHLHHREIPLSAGSPPLSTMR